MAIRLHTRRPGRRYRTGHGTRPPPAPRIGLGVARRVTHAHSMLASSFDTPHLPHVPRRENHEKKSCARAVARVLEDGRHAEPVVPAPGAGIVLRCPRAPACRVPELAVIPVLPRVEPEDRFRPSRPTDADRIGQRRVVRGHTPDRQRFRPLGPRVPPNGKDGDHFAVRLGGRCPIRLGDRCRAGGDTRGGAAASPPWRWKRGAPGSPSRSAPAPRVRGVDR